MISIISRQNDVFDYYDSRSYVPATRRHRRSQPSSTALAPSSNLTAQGKSSLALKSYLYKRHYSHACAVSNTTANALNCSRSRVQVVGGQREPEDEAEELLSSLIKLFALSQRRYCNNENLRG